MVRSGFRSRKRRLLIGLAVVGAMVWLASRDLCGPWPGSESRLVSLSRGEGPLLVGAAQARLELPLPVTVGGYGPWRREATESEPLAARAVVLSAGGERFGLVSVETLLVNDAWVTKVRSAVSFPVWVVATHTHSGPGAFDPRAAVELAGLGRYRADVDEAIGAALVNALLTAERQREPVTLELSRAALPSTVVRARSGSSVDRQLQVVRFRRVEGGSVLAQWVLLALHPTLVARRGTRLDGDYPGELARRLEAGPGAGVVQVLQTAVGNASAAAELRDESAVVRQLETELSALAFQPQAGDVSFATAAARLTVPRPSAQRLVPGLLRPAVENVLCEDLIQELELSVLKLGPLTLLATPLELTEGSAAVLREQAHVAEVLSLANGYLGYVEPQGVAEAGAGESNKQYFGPDLLRQLAEGARLAGDASR